jgi:hypothetical protein
MDTALDLDFDLEGADIDEIIKTRHVGKFSLYHWPLLDIRFKGPRDSEFVAVERLEEMNSNVKLHGRYGYSIGNFHEFFITDSVADNFATLPIAGSIATVGKITPLGYFLFRADCEEDYHGHIAHWQTIRLQNLPPKNLEAVLLKALDVFCHGNTTAIKLRSIEIEEDFYTFLEYGKIDKPIRDVRRVPCDLAPIRLFYYARREEENEAAFIQFYRILEHYAYNLKIQDIAKLRRKTIPETDFLKEAHRIVRQHEKDDLFELIKTLPIKAILTKSHKQGLITASTPRALAHKLYEFRNSVVHAKEDYRVPLLVKSPIGEAEGTDLLVSIIRSLAKAAISKYSSTIS